MQKNEQWALFLQNKFFSRATRLNYSSRMSKSRQPNEISQINVPSSVTRDQSINNLIVMSVAPTFVFSNLLTSSRETGKFTMRTQFKSFHLMKEDLERIELQAFIKDKWRTIIDQEWVQSETRYIAANYVIGNASLISLLFFLWIR